MHTDAALGRFSSAELGPHYGQAVKRLGFQHPYTKAVATVLARATNAPPTVRPVPTGPPQPVFNQNGQHIGHMKGTQDGRKAFVVTDTSGAIKGFADTDYEAQQYLQAESKLEDDDEMSGFTSDTTSLIEGRDNAS